MTTDHAALIAEALRQIVEAFDTGNLEMNSPEIGVGDEPPHPWHEEWLHYARAALPKLEASNGG